MHGITMIFLYASPILSGFSNYLWPLLLGARDMALPAPERLLVLGLSALGTFHLCELPDRRSAQRRLVQLCPLCQPRVQSRAQHGFLRARADLPRALDHGRRHQLHGHDVPHARTRHVDQPRADHGVGHAHRVRRQPARRSGGQSRLLPAVARSPVRHAFLQRATRRRPSAALAASLLDVRPSLGLRHRAAGHGHRLRCIAGVLPPAARWLHRRRALHRADHDPRLRRVAAPYVRHRPAEHRAFLLQRRLHGHRHSERGSGLRLARHHRHRPARSSARRFCSLRASSCCSSSAASRAS